MTRIAILGTGMAGFGAAHRLSSEGVDSVMYDKNPYHGGHATSFQKDGFVFDEGPHVSFTANQRIQDLFAESAGGELEVIETRVNNYWQGHWVKHPAQCNLHGLPTDLVVRVLRDFMASMNEPQDEVKNYRDWLVAAFGRTFAETFPMEYGRKYHTVPAEGMTTDWLGPRLYRPDLEEVLRGALAPDTADVHYVKQFRYPTQDGFVTFLKMFAARSTRRHNYELIHLDPRGRLLEFRNGTTVPYDHVISSLPLPSLLTLIDGAPADVIEASQRLACTTCVIVNVGVARDDVGDAHWTYFYDRDFSFTRVSFPHKLSPNNAPPGTSSIQAELYYSDKYRPLRERQADHHVQPVLSDLKRCGILNEDDRILHTGAQIIPYANVIFDHDRPAALATVHGYLDDVGVSYCGRYGAWGYHWTDQSFVSGEDAAQRVLDTMESPRDR